jgi:hypothetical protein
VENAEYYILISFSIIAAKGLLLLVEGGNPLTYIISK